MHVYVSEVQDGEVDDDVPVWKEDPTEQAQPMIGEQLSSRQKAEIAQLLEEFSDVFQEGPGLTVHDVDTGSAHPVRLPPYRLPHAYREAVHKELKEMLADGLITLSKSAWSAPIVPVKKKDGSLMDYRRLNGVSRFDAYPMPRVDDDLVRQSTFPPLTLLEAIGRYHWQRGHRRRLFSPPGPFGLLQFTVMPFGLQGAPATFQRMVDRLIHSGSYIDDLVIYSETWEEHLQHVRAVFTRLREANLTAKAKKCDFGTAECTYLGHRVGGGVVRPEKSKLLAIQALEVPQTKKDVRTFLGITGYYHRFIPNYSSLATPLTDLTRKSAPNRVVWDAGCTQAYESLKKLLCEDPILHNPDFDKPLRVHPNEGLELS